MKSGIRPLKKDHRDYSLHRTFGGLTPVFTECNFDVGLTNPDQDADGLFYGCTGYTQSDIAGDEDKRMYFPKFTYDRTLIMEGITPSSPNYEKVGCDIRTSLKSTIVYGLQAVGETASEALNHRRGAYYNVDLIQGIDYFDSIRMGLQNNQRSISMATPWFSSFATPQNGIVRAPNSYDTTFASWHNWKVSGWKLINGVPYLIAKSWQGPAYGDKGFCYFSRDIINSLMTINGTGAFTLAPFTGDNVQTVVLTLWQTVLSYLRMILKLS